MLYGNGINNEFFPFCVKKITLAFNLLYFIFFPIYSPWAFSTFFYYYFLLNIIDIKKKPFMYKFVKYSIILKWNIFWIGLFLVKRKFDIFFLRTVLKMDKISFPRAKTWTKKIFIEAYTLQKEKYEYLKLLFK